MNVFRNIDFEFSDNPVTFKNEFAKVMGLAIDLGYEGDPRIDFTVLKALFQVGKIIERLENEGEKRSDNPVKAGSAPKKNRYSDQVIIESFYKCDANKLHAMANHIAELLSEHKEKTKGQKDIPSISTIKRVLRKEGLDKKLKK